MHWSSTVEERFWAKVDKTAGCWNWTAGLNNGYGRFTINYKSFYAHVVSFVWVKGKVPKGKQVHHVCDNKACVRPSHLRAVTGRQNTLACATAPATINSRKKNCKRGHPLSGRNLYVTTDGRRQCRSCRRHRSITAKRKVG